MQNEWNALKTEHSTRFMLKKKKPLGNDLLSREVTLRVPSALTALTTRFEM